MKYGITLDSIIPIRKEPEETSEQVTQLIFGELYIVNKSYNDWVHITSHYDGYEGYISKKNLALILEEEFAEIENDSTFFTSSLFADLENITENTMQALPIGSFLPSLDKSKNEFTINNTTYKIKSKYEDSSKKPASFVMELANKMINTPYLWGGKSSFGIDCSGFIQSVFKIAGCHLSRDAKEQVKSGKIVSTLEMAKPADIAFFENNKGQISHVGILLENGKIIHSSGKVRIDKLDKEGIFNETKGEYTHKLRLIRSIIE